MRISNEYLKGISMFQNKSMSVIDFVSFFFCCQKYAFSASSLHKVWKENKNILNGEKVKHIF